MSKKKRSTHNHKKNEIFKGICLVLERNKEKSFNYKQIAAQLGITDANGRNILIKELNQLKEKREIEEVERGRYKAKPSKNYVTGVLDMTGKGNGYVISEETEKDIFISSSFLNKAFHGDEVEVYLFPRRRKGQRIEGEITRIIHRKRDTFVGIVQEQKNFAFVVLTDSRMYVDIFIPGNKIKKAKDGDKVVVVIEEWSDDEASPHGRIVEVLGKSGEHHTEMHAILAEYGLPYVFPDAVQQYTERVEITISETEIKKRRDMRSISTFTIDPRDAKDFDDALSFQSLENGNYEIGIHIADVTHYVAPGTILDEEAYKRGTSVYLVDRVVPMLPELLSNEVCSLRPEEDKYTFSAVFEMNKKGDVLNKWFGKTAIRSDRRFSYEEAQVIIEQAAEATSATHTETISDSYTIPATTSLSGNSFQVEEPIADAILTLNEMAKTMRKKRMKNGAISFDKIEVKFLLNKDNEPTSVYFKEGKEAHKLIEEFMLLANKEVASYIGKQKKTFVYRVHDDPDNEKLMQLNTIVSRFGYRIEMKDKKTITTSLNALLKEVKGKKEQHLIDTLAIRSMSKAIYTTNNVGHYGLSFDYYTHFTSPIRRYPDIMVHRLLYHYLQGDAQSADKETYEAQCKHASNMENLAVNAERDSIKYMQIKYMENRKDESFVGIISGVTEWGIYVEIKENKCEGMVGIRDMKDDHYIFDEKQYALVGETTKKSYRLGDEVMIKVKDTNLVKRHLDFKLLGEEELI